MKRNKYILLTLLVLLFITGCKKDLLDITPLDKIDPAAFFNNEKEAETALNGIYNALDYWGFPWLSFDAMSDDMYDQYPWEGPTVIGRGVHDPNTSYMRWKWQQDYRGIGRANLFIASIDKADFEQATKDRMIGEAKFLRAYWYSDLVDFYEEVPLILEPLGLEDANVAKSTRPQIVEAVINDLDDAAAKLPDSYSGGNIGRATKGAALALKARVLLYDKQWAAAAQAAKAVMDMNERYSLYPNYYELFTVQAENNSEVVFDVQYIKDLYQNGYSTVIRDWRSFVPLLGLIDDYYMANGLPITDPASGYDPQAPSKNRDPRLNMTLGMPGEEYGGDIYIPFGDYTPTGTLVKKWVEFGNNEYWNSEINIILIRYADVLLMYAEGKIENNDIDQTVYDAINAVRERANMPKIEDVEGSGLSQDLLRQILRHERHIEFVGEGLRYSDIRRWRIAEDVMVDGKGYDKSKLKDPTVPADWVFEEITADTRIFNPAKHYVWPIPQVEIETNPKLKQNPAWN